MMNLAILAAIMAGIACGLRAGVVRAIAHVLAGRPIARCAQIVTKGRGQ